MVHRFRFIVLIVGMGFLPCASSSLVFGQLESGSKLYVRGPGITYVHGTYYDPNNPLEKSDWSSAAAWGETLDRLRQVNEGMAGNGTGSSWLLEGWLSLEERSGLKRLPVVILGRPGISFRVAVGEDPAGNGPPWQLRREFRQGTSRQRFGPAPYQVTSAPEADQKNDHTVQIRREDLSNYWWNAVMDPASGAAIHLSGWFSGPDKTTRSIGEIEVVRYENHDGEKIPLLLRCRLGGRIVAELEITDVQTDARLERESAAGERRGHE